MLVPLIPFFLVARLAIDDSSWTNGPEFVFDVEMNVTFTPMSHDDVQGSNRTSARLLCRPRGSDGLGCRLDGLKRQTLDLTNDKETSVPVNELQREYTEEPFEVKFNEHGVEHLIVKGRTSTLRLNNIKSVVELLSIGADLNGRPDGKFEAPENSTIGSCNVTFEVKHYPSRGAPRRMKDQRYELESLPQLNKVAGETIKIEKEKNLDNCACYAWLYYASYGSDDDGDHSGVHLASSTSHVLVSDTRFVASATSNASAGSHEHGNFTSIVETTTLALKDIKPAEGAWPGIPKASRTSIEYNSDVEPLFPA